MTLYIAIALLAAVCAALTVALRLAIASAAASGSPSGSPFGSHTASGYDFGARRSAIAVPMATFDSASRPHPVAHPAQVAEAGSMMTARVPHAASHAASHAGMMDVLRTTGDFAVGGPGLQ